MGKKEQQRTSIFLLIFFIVYTASFVFIANAVLDWMASQAPKPPVKYTSYK